MGLAYRPIFGSLLKHLAEKLWIGGRAAKGSRL